MLRGDWRADWSGMQLVHQIRKASLLINVFFIIIDLLAGNVYPKKKRVLSKVEDPNDFYQKAKLSITTSYTYCFALLPVH
jgi:hypothetical protein